MLEKPVRLGGDLFQPSWNKEVQIRVEHPKMESLNTNNKVVVDVEKASQKHTYVFFIEDEEHMKLLKILEEQRAHLENKVDKQSATELLYGVEHIEQQTAAADTLRHTQTEFRPPDAKNHQLLSWSGHVNARDSGTANKQHVRENMHIHVVDKDEPCLDPDRHSFEVGSLGQMKMNDLEDDKPVCNILGEVKCSPKKGSIIRKRSVKRKNFSESILESRTLARASAEYVLTNDNSCLGDENLKSTIRTEVVNDIAPEDVKIQKTGTSTEKEKQHQDNFVRLPITNGRGNENVCVDGKILVSKENAPDMGTDHPQNKPRRFAFERLRSFIREHANPNSTEQLPQTEDQEMASEESRAVYDEPCPKTKAREKECTTYHPPPDIVKCWIESTCKNLRNSFDKHFSIIQQLSCPSSEGISTETNSMSSRK